jgi:hypothetical protein
VFQKTRIRFDWSFSHDYEVEESEYAPVAPDSLIELGGPTPKPRFFPANIENELERLTTVVLKITPANGNPWLGVFACGFDSPFVVDAVFSTPDPEKLCIVAGGYSYIFEAGNPRMWDRLPVVPVVHAHSVPESDMLVFGDFTRLAAYGSAGLLWVSERLTWDGIKISGIADGVVRGFGWDATTGRDLEFAVNLATGEHTGGASPRSRNAAQQP